MSVLQSSVHCLIELLINTTTDIGVTETLIFLEKVISSMEKNKVWAGIIGDAVVGVMFLNENLMPEVYLNTLKEAIDPLITELVENQREEFDNAVINEEILPMTTPEQISIEMNSKRVAN